MLNITKDYADINGTVYVFKEIDKLPFTKEDAYIETLCNIVRSWTFNRMTEEEKENCVAAFEWASEQGFIKGNAVQRWEIMESIYTAFLYGIGYPTQNKGWYDWRKNRKEN